ncbi:2-keto-4-pentenoate hydratase/2-oxohepta-3-ene-1,7-dioic acid hydratase in catechol pathway [Neobacillus niacini]|uniref:fumarylacetoacetate hydrolase family protein n=1 Tax=Neobacillus niacini TaxID=86668 RepID=UPI002863776A|nr:fumarylacetoacetate hydrolase family protein [Neobacillus niacini]MDR7080015.1 2-keto-4-pentenoate hydratase/2-oxohepta-3-ene-1,7-dioic acid hydratase in catechol pathway [Neobacillus niacini]
MKFATFLKNENERLAVQVDDRLIDVVETAKKNGWNEIYTDVMQVIELDEIPLKEFEDQIKEAVSNNNAVIIEEEVVWGPCVTKPHKIICVGLNYRKHADETNSPYPEVPILFNKFDNTLTGHQCEIEVPSVTNELDYEVELGIVIGKRTKNVTQEEALSHVFGYCTVNDISARDLQMRTHQWLLGKTSDGFSPVGPYLVTSDEVGDPNNLNLKTYVNGELRQNSNTSDMIFTCKEIVSYISKYMTLEPGDLILTGTPEGVVFGLPVEERVYLQPGDEVSVEIEKLGKLTNKFVKDGALQHA